MIGLEVAVPCNVKHGSTVDAILVAWKFSGGRGECRKKSKKRKTRDADEEAGEEMDDLEAIDAKIAQQEEESRRRKKREHSGASGGEEEGGEKQERGEPMDVDMDVESEEEEDEEFTVRRTGGGSRRKRAIALDEEEEE